MPSSIFFLKKLFFSLGEGGTGVWWLDVSPSEGVLAPGDTLVSPEGCWGGGAILVSGESWGGVSAMADTGPENIIALKIIIIIII